MRVLCLQFSRLPSAQEHQEIIVDTLLTSCNKLQRKHDKRHIKCVTYCNMLYNDMIVCRGCGNAVWARRVVESQGARTVHGPASGRAGKLHVSFGLLLAHFPPCLTTLSSNHHLYCWSIYNTFEHNSILTGKLCYIINREITNVKMLRAFFIKSILGFRNKNF